MSSSPCVRDQITLITGGRSGIGAATATLFLEDVCKIEILFHNAATLCAPPQVPEVDIAVFQKVILTNFCGLFYLAKATISYMRQQGSGSIIATVSTTGFGGAKGLAPYASSKAAITNPVKTMQLDHAKAGIRVNCVALGMTSTTMTAPFEGMPALKEELKALIPMGRFGEADICFQPI